MSDLPFDPRPGLAGALASTGRTVAGIGADQVGAPTPCGEMDTGTLLGHLVGGMDWFSGVAESGAGAPFPETPPITEALAATFDASADRLRAAWAADETLTREYPMPWGPAPGWQLVSYGMVEVLVHGWDLAKATGQPADLPDDLAETALFSVQQWGEETLRQPGMFGPAVPVADDASPTDRLVAFLGRTP